MIARRRRERLDRGARDRAGVGEAARCRLLPGGREERVDDPVELAGVREDHLERTAVFLRLPCPPQRQLGLGGHLRERRSQLV